MPANGGQKAASGALAGTPTRGRSRLQLAFAGPRIATTDGATVADVVDPTYLAGKVGLAAPPRVSAGATTLLWSPDGGLGRERHTPIHPQDGGAAR
jgi:hypothetical protein